MARSLRSPLLSNRGQKQAETGKKFQEFEETALDSYHEEHNPQGTVNLGISENTLLYRELADYFERNLHLKYSDFTYCISHKGNPRLRYALADLLNTQFNPHRPVIPDQIVVGAGLVAISSQLIGALANPGDSVLVASPYYYGFDMEFTVQHGIIPIAVSVPRADMFTPMELSHFETALEESTKKDIKIKAVILCNPHNPLGRLYPEKALIEYCKFCEKHDLQLICDEIYALSVFASPDIPYPQPFVSALSLDLESHGVNPCRVHVLYSMSKDFGCNGFRVGVLITSPHNSSLIQSMIISAFFSCSASPATSLWSTLLSDKPFLSYFLRKNRLKLEEAYEYMTSWLKFHRIPYLPSSAGHFILVDMRPILLDTHRYGTLLSIKSEQDMRERETAFLIFWQNAEQDFVDVALARIEDALGWRRWPGLGQRRTQELEDWNWLSLLGGLRGITAKVCLKFSGVRAFKLNDRDATMDQCRIRSFT
ncbi:pyridoxal phosphate-dependent transferase [Amanita rubescens]|nr:pyridoxal phosphate-dependent transferase [Amanita rubescens]